jgi:Tfp pilus assembly protein PilV
MSLVETTIALSVLAVGILGMIAAQVTALHQNNEGRHSTEAAQLARDQIEMIQRLPWTHTAVLPTGAWTAPRASTTSIKRDNGQTALTEQSFDTSWRVTAGAAPNLRRVDVRVQWTEDTGTGTQGTYRVVMSTLKAQD